MSDRTFLSLVTRLAPSVPGCPQLIVEQYVRDAAIEVCERTLSWRYEQPKIRLTPGVYEYPYENPLGTEIHAFGLLQAVGHSLFRQALQLKHNPQARPHYGLMIRLGT